MNNDISPNDSGNKPKMPIKDLPISQSSPKKELNIYQQFNQPGQFPSSPKQRFEEMIEGQEMGAKNYPSKADVCKGQSPKSIHHYSDYSSNSPIVQYYAGMAQSPIKEKIGMYSPNHQKFRCESPSYQTNYNNQGQTNPNFNHSPSEFFNNSIKKKSSNSPIDCSNSNLNPTSFVSKTLREKMENNFNSSKGIEYNDDMDNITKDKVNNIYNCNESNSISGKIYDDDDNSAEEDNIDKYDLSYESEPENEETGYVESKKIIKEDKPDIKIQPINNNKFDNVNYQCANSNIIKAKNELINLDNETYNNVQNYYSNVVNNYYLCPKTTQNQPLYYKQNSNEQFIPNEKPYSHMDDQSSNIMNKNKKAKRLDPESYINQPYEVLAQQIGIFAKDQGCCRYLQKKLEEDPINLTQALYPSLIEYILVIIVDPFGNYLIQKLLSTLNEIQIHKILEIISENILSIGKNSHGTRVIQQLINYLKTPSLIEYFVSIIKPLTIHLLNELNGTHIVQKFCADYPSYGEKIHLIVIEKCLSLATHRHGCCVLQKYLKTFDMELQQKLLNKLITNCLNLITDQFGNYVIQSIFFLGNIQASNSIALKLLDDICFYSKHKYSSNVVEKCFDFCDDTTKQKLIEVLSFQEAINDLILDEQGNYVIQKVLAHSNPSNQSNLLQMIAPLFGKLKVLPFGKHIISRLCLLYPQLINKGLAGDMNNYKGPMYGNPVIGNNNSNRFNNKDMENKNQQGFGNNYKKKNYKNNNAKNNANKKNQKKDFDDLYNANAMQQKYK